MQDAIARVQTLEEEGRLTGVMDDRGKFIHISRAEMAAVADFICARGRVAIGELAAMSASFIDLEQKCALAALMPGFPVCVCVCVCMAWVRNEGMDVLLRLCVA